MLGLDELQVIFHGYCCVADSVANISGRVTTGYALRNLYVNLTRFWILSIN